MYMLWYWLFGKNMHYLCRKPINSNSLFLCTDYGYSSVLHQACGEARQPEFLSAAFVKYDNKTVRPLEATYTVLCGVFVSSGFNERSIRGYRAGMITGSLRRPKCGATAHVKAQFRRQIRSCPLPRVRTRRGK